MRSALHPDRAQIVLSHIDVTSVTFSYAAIA